MTIRKLESQPGLSTMLTVMGAKSPPDEKPIGDVRRIGRSNNVARSTEDNESIERALAELATDPVADDAPKSEFMVRARNEPSVIPQEHADRRPAGRPKDVPRPTPPNDALDIARFIADEINPPNWLVVGLQRHFAQLSVGRHYSKKRLSTEVRAEMRKVEKAAKTFQDLLRDTELLSHLSVDSLDNLPNRNQFFAGVNWIAKRAAIAAAPGKQGRPKKRYELASPQFKCAVVVCIAWRIVWQKSLSSSSLAGRQACEMLFTKFDEAQRSDGSPRRESDEMVTWEEWIEKALDVVEAIEEDDLLPSSRKTSGSGEDRLSVKFAREVERNFRRSAGRSR
jgi:hypothetical protein